MSSTLQISFNESLVTLEGLENLISVGEDLDLRFNTLLGSVAGLEGLSSVGGTFNIGSNDSLGSLDGLENLGSIGADFYVAGNESLAYLSGLEVLASIGGVLRLEGNPSLETAAGLENLTSVGSLHIRNNDSLTSLIGLGNVVSIDGSVFIADNVSLVSVAGLEGLTAVSGLFLNNNALTSLVGLENLTSVEYVLHISDNDSLASLAGLEQVTSVGENLFITLNDALTSCSCGSAGLVSGDPPTFSGVAGEVFIVDNNPGGTCTSPEVVLANPCEPVSNEGSDATLQALRLEAFPNPVAGAVTLQYALPEAVPVRLAVYDLLGREVAVLADGVQSPDTHEVTFAPAGLAAGFYIVRMVVGDGASSQVLTRRVTVLD